MRVRGCAVLPLGLDTCCYMPYALAHLATLFLAARRPPLQCRPRPLALPLDGGPRCRCRSHGSLHLVGQESEAPMEAAADTTRSPWMVGGWWCSCCAFLAVEPESSRAVGV